MKYLKWVLFFIIIIIIYYLANTRETFTNNSTSSNLINNISTSVTVNMPLLNSNSCSNFCGPKATCAMTGDQCSSDMDCSGCMQDGSSNNIPVANNDSTLTTGYGTHEKIITDNYYEKPAQGNFGTNTWKNAFTIGQQLYNKTYNQSSYISMNYPIRYSITGEFTGNGPLPANF